MVLRAALIILFSIAPTAIATIIVDGKPLDPIDHEGVAEINAANVLLQKAIDEMPEGSWKNGFKKYIEIVNPTAYLSGKVEKSNPGVQEYVLKTLTGGDRRCLRAAEKRFYADVKATVDKSRADYIAKHGESASLKHYDDERHALDDNDRTTIDDEAGKGQSENLEPGWLWKLAMKHAKGDANVAMFLIGSCGHDDHTNFLSMELVCPGRNSSTFLAKSLGSEVDISPSLKNKIHQIQGPGRTTPIASKNYHIIAGAFKTCELIRSGIEPDVAQRIEVLGSRMYRSLAVCGTAREVRKEEQWLESEYRNSKNMKPSDSIDIEKMRVELLNATKTTKCSWNKDAQQPLDKAVCRYANLMRGQGYSPQATAERLEYFFARADAANLYDRWYFGGGKTPEITNPFTSKTILKSYDIPCTDIRKGGPANLLNGSQTGLGQWEKPWGWNSDRYQKALNHLATWELDFQWTQAQHEVGSSFAKKICKKEDPDRTYEKLCDGDEKDDVEDFFHPSDQAPSVK